MPSIAIFGGSFDPVHNGHILTSKTIQAFFGFDSYYFLPCKNSTIKVPTFANCQQRIEMLQLALKNNESFKLDLREIARDTPSYMVETLTSFRKENENDSITLILGYDAFLSLPFWYQWKKIIKLANLLVINRENYSNHTIPESIQKLVNLHKTSTKADVLTKPLGLIYFFNAGNYDISSTEIRADLKRNRNVDSRLPKEVYEYIMQKQLYQ